MRSTQLVLLCLAAILCSPDLASAALGKPDFRTDTESYWIVKGLGQGAFGKVYEVEDSAGTHYALKTQLRAQQDDQMFKQLLNDLEREFERGQSLDHPNIIKTYELHHAEHAADQSFLVMELVDGQPLYRIGERSLKLGQLVRVLNELLNVLRYAHSNGVYYVDLHAGNIMLTKDCHIKFVDLAGFMTHEELEQLLEDHPLMTSNPALAPIKDIVAKELGSGLLERVDRIAQHLINCSSASRKDKQLLSAALSKQLGDARQRVQLGHLTGERPGRYKQVINRLANTLKENRGQKKLNEKAFRKFT